MEIIPIPAPAKRRLQVLLDNANSAQVQFRQYAEGVKDGLGLDGEYSLDTSVWEFKPMVESEEPKPLEE